MMKIKNKTAKMSEERKKERKKEKERIHWVWKGQRNDKN